MSIEKSGSGGEGDRSQIEAEILASRQKLENPKGFNQEDKEKILLEIGALRDKIIGVTDGLDLEKEVADLFEKATASIPLDAEWDDYFQLIVDQVYGLLAEVNDQNTTLARLREIRNIQNQMGRRHMLVFTNSRTASVGLDGADESERAERTTLKAVVHSLIIQLLQEVSSRISHLEAAALVKEKPLIDPDNWPDSEHPIEAIEFETAYMEILGKLDDPTFDPRKDSQEKKLNELQRVFELDLNDPTGFAARNFANPIQVREILRKRYIDKKGALSAGKTTIEDVRAAIESRKRVLKTKETKALDKKVLDARDTLLADPGRQGIRLNEVLRQIDEPLPTSKTPLKDVETRLTSFAPNVQYLRELVADSSKPLGEATSYFKDERDKAQKQLDAILGVWGSMLVDRASTVDGSPNPFPEFGLAKTLRAEAETALLSTSRDEVEKVRVAKKIQEAIQVLEKLDIPKLVLMTGEQLSPPISSQEIIAKNKQDLIEEIHSQLEKLTIISRVIAEIEKKWKQMVESLKPTIGYDPNDERLNKPYRDGDIENAGILSLVDHFMANDRPLWDNKIALYNAITEGAKSDTFKQLAWFKNKEGREAADKHANFDNLRAFKRECEKRASTSGMFKMLEDVFAKGPVSYVVAKYDPDDFPDEEAFDGWRVVHLINISSITSVRKKYKNEKTFIHNYARDGNPDSEGVLKGKQSVAQLIKLAYPDVPQSTIDTLMYAATMGEIRLKYHVRYHANYLKSPDGVLDLKALSTHSPLAVILYKIRSGANIPSEYRLLWQVMRLPGRRPDRKGMYLESAVDPRINPLAYDEFKHEQKKRGISDDDGEFLPLEAKIVDKEPNKDDPMRAVGNNNVRAAIELRNLADRALTTSYREFTPVKMEASLNLLPFFWDVAYAEIDDRDNPGEKKQKYGGISFKDYTLALENWNAFLDHVQNPGRITHTDEVSGSITKLIQMISPTKALLSVLSKKTPEGVRFRELTTQLILRYIKNVYDQYDAMGKLGFLEALGEGGGLEGNPKTKRTLFISYTIDVFENMKTLDPAISKPILTFLRRHLYELQYHFFDSLFSQAKEDITGPDVSHSERGRRQNLLRLYYGKPPEVDKK